MKFNKDAKAVSAPSGAKNVTELYKTVMDAIEEYKETANCRIIKIQYPSYYNTYCDAKTNTIKPQYQDQFTNSSNRSLFEI